MSAIDDKYNSVIHDHPSIGAPTTPESICPDHVGHFRHYAGNASIYWTPTTGAHLIYGLIRQKWAALGWERGPNGYPTTDEGDAGSHKGRYNNFQNGTIIWKTNSAAAFSVHGAIYSKWGTVGYDTGLLGFPLTDETGTPDGVGRFNHFDGGSIYWSPATGAHIVTGAIRQKWSTIDWERGALGYPVSDEQDLPGHPGGRVSHFQGGDITWTPAGGAVVVRKIVTRTWHFNDFGAGKIDVHSMTLTFSNNGVWTWTANLHDNSTFYGDNYAIGFAFNGLGHGQATSGSLGAKIFGPSVDGTVNMSGTDAWLADNFFLVGAKGAMCHLHVSGDIGQLLGGLLDDLLKVAGAVLKLLASGNGTGGTSEPGDDGQDDGGGDEGTDALRLRLLHLSTMHPDIKLDPQAVPAHAVAAAVVSQ